jgi:hypothetical protein
MSEPGINTDQSRIRPSRRADIPPWTWLEGLQEKPRYASLRRFLAGWRHAPSAARTIDYTILEGDPTDRADLDLPIDLPRGAEMASH